MGFVDADRVTLLAIRRNLLAGLDQFAAHADAGTLYVVPAGGSTPPVASGWLMTVLLEQVNDELRSRQAAADVVPAR